VTPRWALALLAASEACSWGCGGQQATGPVTPEALAIYSAALQRCVAQAVSYDAGASCMEGVKQVFCDPGGVWADAGVCDAGPIGGH
jgi:hypothetical protein